MTIRRNLECHIGPAMREWFKNAKPEELAEFARQANAIAYALEVVSKNTKEEE